MLVEEVSVEVRSELERVGLEILRQSEFCWDHAADLRYYFSVKIFN